MRRAPSRSPPGALAARARAPPALMGQSKTSNAALGGAHGRARRAASRARRPARRRPAHARNADHVPGIGQAMNGTSASSPRARCATPNHRCVARSAEARAGSCVPAGVARWLRARMRRAERRPAAARCIINVLVCATRAGGGGRREGTAHVRGPPGALSTRSPPRNARRRASASANAHLNAATSPARSAWNWCHPKRPTARPW
jgi:hypothetical protein